MFGLCGVGPGAGGGDVRVWDGAILHPHGVATLSWKGKDRGKQRRQTRDKDMSKTLICPEET